LIAGIAQQVAAQLFVFLRLEFAYCLEFGFDTFMHGSQFAPTEAAA
jgi:hypothetical protein